MVDKKCYISFCLRFIVIVYKRGRAYIFPTNRTMVCFDKIKKDIFQTLLEIFMVQPTFFKTFLHCSISCFICIKIRIFNCRKYIRKSCIRIYISRYQHIIKVHSNSVFCKIFYSVRSRRDK